MFTWTVLFHIVGLVFWVGGLLVATALLGQHAKEESPEGQLALGQAELRMLSGMANPGAAITIITGAILSWSQWPDILHETWFESKMALVLTLIVLHVITYTRARQFVDGRRIMTRRNWMVLHGAISLVFLAILICVLPGRAYWK
ncbi:MAG TPA: CopD family protein [Terriglobia bacterium]|nr:CopD family protein [Terriglobia bacterium]